MKREFITSGFAAFRRGKFGNGGQNLYVSAAGVLQRIYQYDLNRNGYVDLVFANCQDHHESAPSYVYNLQGKRLALPGQGSVCGMTVDLNGDGYQDLVVAGHHDMAAPYASTDIYFGGPEGYSENRHIRIPTPWAEDCCYGKFDSSGHPTLAFALPVYHTVRLFHQSELGLEWQNFEDLPLEGNLLAAADLDGDGFDELIVRRDGETATRVYWGGATGIDIDNFTELPELPAADILQPEEEKTMQSDMEKKFEAPRLLQKIHFRGRDCFTLSTGKKVFFYSSDTSHKLHCVFEVEVPMALAVAAGDIRGTGGTDLAFACRVRNPENAHQQCSFIYWEGDSGYDVDHRTALDTQQACDVTIASATATRPGRVLFVQTSAGHRYTNSALVFTGNATGIATEPQRLETEDARRGFWIFNPGAEPQIFVVNHFARSSVGFDRTYVYWGGPQGYSEANRLEVPGWCAVDSLIADLDDDGWAELLVANNSENSLHLDPGHLLHHFGPHGFESQKSRCLKTDLGWGVVAGDFNHDGYLEIVTPCNHWCDLRIFYGKTNYETYDTIDLQGIGSPRWICAADLNHNGYLDLIVPIITSSRSLILWGGPQGFSRSRSTELAVLHGVSANAADLTGNGYPDIIIGGHTDTPKNGELPDHDPHNSFLYIYWNGPDGIQENNKCLLRADAACSLAIADFNNDGYLDIFAGSYHGGVDRDINSFLYWNRQGQFHELDRDLLYTHSASGCVAADFNEDGYIDLAIANHKVDGDHHGFSSVWWNGPHGFNAACRTDLPTEGPHGMISVNPGNILTRGPEEYYESELFATPEAQLISRYEVEADIPPKTWVKLQVRVGRTALEIASAVWQEPNQITTLPGGFLQYQLVIGAINGLRTPRISRVYLELE